MAKFSAPQAKFFKTRHFLENFDEKIAVFSERSSPSNLVNIGAQVPKTLGSVSQKWKSQNSTKGDPLGRQEVEPPEEGSSPLNPALMFCVILKRSSSLLHKLGAFWRRRKTLAWRRESKGPKEKPSAVAAVDEDVS